MLPRSLQVIVSMLLTWLFSGTAGKKVRATEQAGQGVVFPSRLLDAYPAHLLKICNAVDGFLDAVLEQGGHTL